MNLAERIKQWTEQHNDMIIEGMVDLLQIPTIYEEETVSEKAPYGEGIANGLAWMKERADQDGFNTFNDKGQYLVIELPASEKTDKRIDVVGHMDVVSVGDGWNYDPFGAEIVGDNLYARGAQDMKVAVWLSYVSLLLIKEMDLTLTHNLRLVVGTDEESSFEDIVYYVEQNGLPNFMFTPDSSFQITLGEKGDAAFSLEGKIQSSIVETIETFNSENAINDRVDVILKEEAIDKVTAALEELTFKHALVGNSLTIYGKSAHSSKPELGENALAHLFKLLAEKLDEEWAVPFNAAFNDYNGAGLNLKPHYEPMGSPTVNPSQCHLTDGELRLVVDIRFPNPVTKAQLQATLESKFPNFIIGNHFHFPPTEISMDNPYVNQLMGVYDDWIAENQPAFYSGGITYAKLFQGVGVAFGITYLNDGMENRAHQADEYFNLSAMPTVLGALTDAMVRLVQL